MIWVFGEDSGGAAVDTTWLQAFVTTTEVKFLVAGDHKFNEIYSYITPDVAPEVLPQQYLIDARNMELVDITSGIGQPNWDALNALLDRE